MRDTHSHTSYHPLLHQTPLTLNPFLDLPKPPTLPPNYVVLSSTLPASVLNAPPANTGAATTQSELPAYVTTNHASNSGGGAAAHPSAIIELNESLIQAMRIREEEARREVEAWEQGVRERELGEKRRRAPGWLDSEQHLLSPEKKGEVKAGVGQSSGADSREYGLGNQKVEAVNLMDDDGSGGGEQQQQPGRQSSSGGQILQQQERGVGEDMDRVFGL